MTVDCSSGAIHAEVERRMEYDHPLCYSASQYLTVKVEGELFAKRLKEQEAEIKMLKGGLKELRLRGSRRDGV